MAILKREKVKSILIVFVVLLINVLAMPNKLPNRNQNPSVISKLKETDKWRESPVVVGGTGGSGTRGVEDVLNKLGVYMYPRSSMSPIVKLCYNSARDNHCMSPQGKLVQKEVRSSVGKQQARLNESSSEAQRNTLLLEWLYQNDVGTELDKTIENQDALEEERGTYKRIRSCRPQNFESLEVSKDGQKFMDSVPISNRQPLRWGWKHPRSMYYLNKLYKLYPGMVYIHVLRQPLDMASSFLEHLQHRVAEFKDLNGGTFEAASLSYERSCRQIKSSGLYLFKSKEFEDQACRFPLESFNKLRTQSKLSHKLNPNGDSGAVSGPKLHKMLQVEVHPMAIRCMDMMLWAQMNNAVGTFGARCLEPTHRYFHWHTEDDLGIRGQKNRTNLINQISQSLSLDSLAVDNAMKASSTPLRKSGSSSHRRLSYGKYKESLKRETVALLQQCAEIVAPGCLNRFQYKVY